MSPVAEGFVAGECDRLLLLIALADDLEEQAGLDGVELKVADFVKDEEFWLHKVLEFPVQAIAIDSLGEFVCQVHGGGEVVPDVILIAFFAKLTM